MRPQYILLSWLHGVIAQLQMDQSKDRTLEHSYFKNKVICKRLKLHVCVFYCTVEHMNVSVVRIKNELTLSLNGSILCLSTKILYNSHSFSKAVLVKQFEPSSWTPMHICRQRIWFRHGVQRLSQRTSVNDGMLPHRHVQVTK